MRKLTAAALALAESAFLRAHGWTKMHGDWWCRPSWYDPNRNGGEEHYRHGHAVNSQKWTNAQAREYSLRERRAEERGMS